jgi:uncharacterized HAD superfamily protein
MNIALDIDGVIADTSRVVKDKVLKHFDLKDDHLIPGHDYNNIYLMENQEVQDEVNSYIKELFVTEPEVYLEADEIKGSWFGSRLIKPVAYITRRPDQYGIAEATRLWLSKNYFYPAPVFFIPKGTCKSTKAKELGVDVLIEDSPYEIMSCRENNLRTLVFRYKYNDAVVDRNTTTVNDWDNILKWYENNVGRFL